MTASPPPPVPPLVKALREVREMLHRAVRKQDLREVEAAIERINSALNVRLRQDSLLDVDFDAPPDWANETWPLAVVLRRKLIEAADKGRTGVKVMSANRR